ncbi:hypothetical protein M3P05_13565 [Sansalvadorimonas sp. 2012CJ34-2]|uniref:Uncharacterized protein n=1 Tax=Parendozoicomonas callyspongiae TaxID=2942213 RepID=A0ABT0PHZ0_9GAMM|nr:hypothetical protein [Sansalvadorimonas sp. 2012CJ34-2]MCL6270953.1 hypothetical protein [Sansalvadorimonas sp. 2012CJ34-2]
METAPMTQPDIEVYIRQQPVDLIIDWLDDRFDSSTEVQTKGRSHSLEVTLDSTVIPVTIVENAAGKAWTSLWFDSSATPWGNDVESGREINSQLKCKVRCNAAFWKNGADNMDEWMEISEDGSEILIDWPS